MTPSASTRWWLVASARLGRVWMMVMGVPRIAMWLADPMLTSASAAPLSPICRVPTCGDSGAAAVRCNVLAMSTHTSWKPSELHDGRRTESGGERVETRELTVAGRFCGPPGMGNGGWIAGSLARYVSPGPAQVTLRVPAPLDRPLTVRTSAETVQLVDGDTVCAEATRTGSLDIELPAPVSFDVAASASAGFVGHHEHPFPACFVCGPEREPDDGLRVFPGPVDGRPGVVAAPWVPGRSVVGSDTADHVRTEAIWAALDCPTGWAHYEPGGLALLGRHTVEVARPIVADETYVVVAERKSADGRKLHATAALYAADGTMHASARALWITLTAR